MAPVEDLKLLHQLALQESFVATKELLECARKQPVKTAEDVKHAARFLKIVNELIKEVGGNYKALMEAKGILEAGIQQQLADDDL